MNKSVSEAATALRAAVKANHFGVIRAHNLQETKTKKEVALEEEVTIVTIMTEAASG